MPEYDAFGREIGEDPLAAWRAAEPAAKPQPEPEPEPAAAQAPADPPVPTPAPPAPTPDPALAPPAPPVTASPTRREPPPSARIRRRRPRVVSRLILLLVVVVAAANLIGGAADKVKDAVDDLPALTPPTVAPKAAPVGLRPGSMIRPAELRRALADLRARRIGRIRTLRVAPERIDASLLTRRTTLVNVQLRHDGQFQRFSESGAGFGHLDTISFTALDPAAPARLVRAAAARLHRPTTRIDYLVPMITNGKITWGAYFKEGPIFLADAQGHITRRLP